MRKNAFTVMEMVIVMLIVAVLFLLTIPNIRKTLNIVEDRSCQAQKKLVDAAILQYRLKNDEDPHSMEDLVKEGLLSKRQTKCFDKKQIRIHNGQAKISE